MAHLFYSCYSLIDLVKAVIYLIHHPVFDSPVHSLGVAKNPAQLARQTMRLLAGLPVNGLSFPPNSAWVEWARVNDCLPSEEEEMEEAEVEVERNMELDREGEEIYESVNTVSSDDRVNEVTSSVNNVAKMLLLDLLAKH